MNLKCYCTNEDICIKSSSQRQDVFYVPFSKAVISFSIVRHLKKGFSTYLNWKLSWIAPIRKMTSMMFNATRQKLKEFLIFGRTRTWPARMLEKTPILATMVLMTPSSQYAKVKFQNFSDSEWIGQRAVKLSFWSVDTLVKR